MPHTISRRDFLTGLAGTGMVAASGISLLHDESRLQLFNKMSRWNDLVQQSVYSPDTLARVYSWSDITTPFPYNGFYPEAYVPKLDIQSWRLSVDGEVERPRRFNLSDLKQMHHEEQISQLICIEGWSAVGHWSGVPLKNILVWTGANPDADHVRFDCADGYYCTIDMASALHPQTLLALNFLKNPLPEALGAPVRLRIPVKLGFKNAKYITGISVGSWDQAGYWEEQGYNWFSGL